MLMPDFALNRLRASGRTDERRQPVELLSCELSYPLQLQAEIECLCGIARYCLADGRALALSDQSGLFQQVVAAHYLAVIVGGHHRHQVTEGCGRGLGSEGGGEESFHGIGAGKFVHVGREPPVFKV